MAKLAVFIIGIVLMGAVAYVVLNRNIKKNHTEQDQSTDDEK